jgi:hypothetical protein
MKHEHYHELILYESQDNTFDWFYIDNVCNSKVLIEHE